MGFIKSKAVKRVVVSAVLSSSLLGAGTIATAHPASAMEVNIASVNSTISQSSDSSIIGNLSQLVQIVVNNLTALQQKEKLEAYDRTLS